MGNQGRFVWYELMAADTGTAAFYATVVGWKTQDAGQSDITYTAFLTDAGRVAGMLALSEAMRGSGIRPGWIGYIAVDDVDPFAARVAASGGKVHRPPTDIPQIGRFAVVADPQGAVFVLFHPLPTATPPDLRHDTPGTIGWCELMAGDGETAFDFYAGLFGWTLTDTLDMGPMGKYHLFAPGGAEPVGGIMTRMPEMPAALWRYYFRVDGIAAAADRVRGAGGTVTREPQQVPGGEWILHGSDPEGTFFALVSEAA